MNKVLIVCCSVHFQLQTKAKSNSEKAELYECIRTLVYVQHLFLFLQRQMGYTYAEKLRFCRHFSEISRLFFDTHFRIEFVTRGEALMSGRWIYHVLIACTENSITKGKRSKSQFFSRACVCAIVCFEDIFLFNDELYAHESISKTLGRSGPKIVNTNVSELN